MVVHLLLILEDLLADLAPEFFNSDLFKVSIRQCLFFLLSIFLCDFLSVLSQLLLFFESLLLSLLEFLLFLGFLLSALSHLELLVALVSLLDVLKQLDDGIIELFSLSLSLLLVLIIDDTFDPPIGGLIWVVLVGIRELLFGAKVLPVLVESEDLICGGVPIAKVRQSIVLLTYCLFLLFLFIELSKELSVHSVEVIILAGVEA